MNGLGQVQIKKPNIAGGQPKEAQYEINSRFWNSFSENSDSSLNTLPPTVTQNLELTQNLIKTLKIKKDNYCKGNTIEDMEKLLIYFKSSTINTPPPYEERWWFFSHPKKS